MAYIDEKGGFCMFALLDLEKFYTGSYVNTGGIVSNNVAPTLPPTDDLEKAMFYKYDYRDVTTITQQPITQIVITVNEESGETIETEEPVLDEYGNQVYEDIEVIESVLDWIFDEEKYNAYLIQKSKEVPKSTTNEKIVVLQEDDELLKGCIMELASIIFE